MSENLPILYRNIMDGLPSDIARDVFLWAVERSGEDRQCYRAEAFAREADKLLKTVTGLIDIDQYLKFGNLSAPLLAPEGREDLTNFIMKRHANWRYGGNVAPPYCN